MRNLLSRLLGGASPTGKALRVAHEAAEKARLEAINREPPPGNGWRLAPQDSEGKWTVWNGPRAICSFWDENEAADYARRQNADPRPNPVMRDDGKYCVNCGSHETDESLRARAYVSCCPERYVIPEAWAVTADRLATGQYHLWRPADGLPSIDADHSWPTRTEAQREADARNLAAHREECRKLADRGGEGHPAEYEREDFRARAAANPGAVFVSTPMGRDGGRAFRRFQEAPDLSEGLTAAKLAVTDESGHSSGFGVDVDDYTDPLALRAHISNPRIVIEPKDPDAALRGRVRQAVADGLLSETPAERDARLGTYKRPRNVGMDQGYGRPSFIDPEPAAGSPLAEFLNVPVPEGVRLVVGPRKSPEDGNWWTFDRNGPVRGYTRKTNAQAAADRANNGPAT